jgi:adenylylsulfate kinase-like enzyme
MRDPRMPADDGESRHEPARGGQHVAIITGLSGAGKTATSKLF